MKNPHAVVGMVVCLSFAGCATTEELDALKANLSASIAANRQVLATRITGLEQSKEQWEKQQEQLAKAVERQDETIAKLSRLDRDYAGVLDSHKDAINRLAETTRQVARETADLREALEAEHGTIAAVLQAEESFHREGLRTVQQIRHELSLRRRHSPSNGATSLFPVDPFPHEDRATLQQRLEPR